MAQTPTPPTPDGIAGYSYGSAAVRRSPVSLAELGLLRQAAQFGAEEERWLRRAGEILVDEADALVDEWRGVIAAHPHLAAYSAGTDGQPNPAYGAASRPRFVQWVRDVCRRPYDQAWLDYQHEIGLRHTHAGKNRTDGVASAPHIPLRYVLAFAAVVMTTTRPYLARRGHSAGELEQMYDAWCKAVILHVTLWSEAYVALADW
jgi:protoglobin